MTGHPSPRGAFVLFAALAASAGSHAGRPLQTDDAAVLSPGDCQFEAGARSGRGQTDLEVKPSCHLVGNVEWGVPLGHARSRGEPSSRSLALESKWAVRPVVPGSWGWGVSGGLAADVTSRPRSEAAYAQLIGSLAPNERWAMHVNAGALRERDARTQPTWAAALEHAVRPSWVLTAETYGQRGTRPYLQIGTRWQVTEALAFDLSAGGQRGGAEAARFVSIGLTLSGRFPRPSTPPTRP